MVIIGNEPFAGAARRLRASSIASLVILVALAAQGCSSAQSGNAATDRQSAGITALAPGLGCPAHTPAFWAVHTDQWPVSSLTLGGTSDTAAQLLAILQDTSDDARVRLEQQLIAALLDAASGTDSTRIAGTIADANTLLASTTGTPGIFSPDGLLELLEMLDDTVLLANYTDGGLTSECGAPPGSCEAWSDVSVLVAGRDVVAYVPSYQFDGVNNTFSGSGIAVLNVEGTRVTPTVIPTPDTVISCATNSFTGQTVCNSQNNVYLVSGTTIQATLTNVAGGSDTDQGVVMDPIRDKALLGLANGIEDLASAGFQFLDLGSSPSFEPPIPAAASALIYHLPGALLDPFRGLVVAPAGNFSPWEVVNLTTSPPETFVSSGTLPGQSAGEDCSTGLAVSAYLPAPQNALAIELYNLAETTFTPGSPYGTWSTSENAPILAGTSNEGWGEVAVAQGTHTGIAAPKLFDDNGIYPIVAFALPPNPGASPTLDDWLDCPLFEAVGPGPQGLTAFKSPTDGHAIALVVDVTQTQIAAVDLTRMLDPTVVPRTAGGHTCAAGSLPSSVLGIAPLP